MTLTRQKNMGKMDRIVRGTLGAVLLLNGLRNLGNSPLRKIETLIGGAFFAYGVSGFDPLLSAYGASTIPGRENSLWNLFRQALPGQGIKPTLTQYVLPKGDIKRFNENTTIAEALAVT